MRILFLGSGEFGVPTLEALCDDRHVICAVVTRPDRPAGRGRQPAPTPVKQLALRRGLPLMQPENVNAPDVVAKLSGLKAELGVVVAFGQKIGPELLRALPCGMINLHGSLLPRYRGAAPVNWAIINGETETGLTVFRLGESIDAGPILLQRPVAIGPEETAGELHDRLARLGPELIRQAIRLFQSGPDPPSHPQDPRRACPAPKLTKADGLIRFDQPAQVVAQRIRGLWPWPGAACRFVSADATRSETVTLARAVPAGEPAPNTDLPPGTISQQLTVACQPGHLRIIELRPAGSRLMSYQPDFVNGRRVRPADRFEPLS